MTLYEIVNYIKDISQLAHVNSAFIGDIYDLNHRQDVNYPAFVITQGTHRTSCTDEYDAYNLNLFLVDRLLEDKSNELEVQDWAYENLQSIVQVLDNSNIGIEQNASSVTTFTEKFNSLCAGGYLTLNLRVQKNICCTKPMFVSSVNGKTGDITIDVFPDAPSDGILYARRNGKWEEVKNEEIEEEIEKLNEKVDEFIEDQDALNEDLIQGKDDFYEFKEAQEKINEHIDLEDVNMSDLLQDIEDTNLRVDELEESQVFEKDDKNNIKPLNRTNTFGNDAENAIIIGTNCFANGLDSCAEGTKTNATKAQSHAEGYETNADGAASHAEGGGTTASGERSHAEGSDTKASGKNSHAEGAGNTTASGEHSHAEGWNTQASGNKSHTEGENTVASGENSHAEGYHTTANTFASHAEGYYTTASGDYSHSEGFGTDASASHSHAEGYYTKSAGHFSHAEGSYAEAKGSYSHAEGCGTIASGIYSHAQGTYNVENANAIHQIGIGVSNKRKDAHTILSDGKQYILGIGDYDGTNIDNAKSLQEVVDDIKGKTYTAGEGIYISDDNVISLETRPYIKLVLNDEITRGLTTQIDYFEDGIVPNGKYNSNKKIISVEIGEGITNVGKEVFSYCNNLTTVVFSNTVTYIGQSTFFGCSSFTSVTIPNSVETIDSGAFSAVPASGILTCDETWYNNLSSTNKTNLGNAYNWTRNQLPQTIDERVDELDERVDELDGRVYTFEEKYDSNIKISEIENGLFDTNSRIDEVEESLPNKQDVLVSGTNIKTINGESILGEGDITIEGGGDTIKAGEGIYISEDEEGAKVISTKPYSTSADTYVAWCNADGNWTVDYFDNGIIPYDKYKGNTNIEEVIIGDGITEIKYEYQMWSGFYGCINLKKIKLSNKLKTITNYAFNGCSSLTSVGIEGSGASVEIPNSVKSIGTSAFTKCVKIENVTIPNSVTSINGFAFFGCSSLTSVTISDSVTTILSYAFGALPSSGVLTCDETWYNNLSSTNIFNLSNVYNWTRKPLPKPLDERVDELDERVDELEEKVDELQLYKFPNATIFGQPTIQNGQVSNFSNNNYLQFPFLVDFQNRPFNIYFSFTTPSDLSGQQNILDSNYGLAFAIRNGKVVTVASDNGTSWTTGELISDQTLTPNTTYYFRIRWYRGTENPFLSVVGGLSKDDTTISMGVVTEPPYPKTIYIGRSYVDGGNYFKGSINLNDASLEISDKVVWTGMDDVGLATRAAIDLSNLDAKGNEVIDNRIDNKIANKQDVLVSGTNIKTINGESILGEGNIEVKGGGGVVNLTQAEYNALSTKDPNTIYNITDATDIDVYTKDEVDGLLNNKLDTSGGTLSGKIQIGDATSNIANAILHMRNVTSSITGKKVNGACYSVNGDGTASLQHKTYNDDGSGAKNAAVLRMSNQGLQFAINTGSTASPTEDMYYDVMTSNNTYNKTEIDNKIGDIETLLSQI